MRWARLNPKIYRAALPSLQLARAIHDGNVVIVSTVGQLITLPPAAASGSKFRVIVQGPISGVVLKTAVVPAVPQVFVGGLVVAGASTVSFPTVAGSNTITLNGGTTGGAGIGDWIEFDDALLGGYWCVRGMLYGAGAVVTPFSAT